MSRQLHYFNKLKWIYTASRRIVSGAVAPVDALHFISERIWPTKKGFKLREIQFPMTNRLLWQQVFQIFLRAEYNPLNFEISIDDVVVDIGANMGVFTAYAASCTNRSVIAFEPDKDSFERLKQLVTYNKLSNVVLYNKAVTGRTGPIRLYKSNERSTLHTINPQDVLSGELLPTFDEVQAVSLDDALAAYDQIDFLKVDCEGAEFDIFLNASDTTLKKVKKIVMEYHTLNCPGGIESLVERLRNATFSIRLESHSNLPIGLLFASS